MCQKSVKEVYKNPIKPWVIWTWQNDHHPLPCFKTNQMKGNRAYLKPKTKLQQTNKSPKESHTHTAHYPNVHYKLSNSLQQFLYSNALQILRHFEITLLHHSDHTIYFTKPQVHWKLVLNERLSWCIFSSFFFPKTNTHFLWSNWFSNLHLGRRKEWE